MKKNLILALVMLLGLTPVFAMQTTTVYQRQEQTFINKIVAKDHFNRAEVYKLIYNIHLLPAVIRHMERPYEAKPWYIYRVHFMKQARIDHGVIYWHNHAADLTAAEKTYGVNPGVIVAIVGVESFYGKIKGSYPTLNALATLAFAYPPRSKFFTAELEQYLLLTRELHIKPETLYGSYAGALGLPQFMPSSYRHYAVGNRDLLHDTGDVIASVANYLKKAGWQRGQPIAVPAKVSGEKYKKLLNRKLKAKYTVAELAKYGITPVDSLPANTKVNFIRLEDKNGFEYWLGLRNFYAITRYNTSIQYAMAVYQLAEAISAAK